MTITDATDAGRITVAASVAVDELCLCYEQPGELRDYDIRQQVGLTVVGFTSGFRG